LIVADKGRAEARDLVREALARGERVMAADLLFTGECLPASKSAWKYAQMIATVGRRPLGIQVAQLEALVRQSHEANDTAPIRIVAKGRMAGLATLTFAAIHPGRVTEIELHEMDRSLRSLVEDEISYAEAPSMFCFGLLEVADVPGLSDLARPTRVRLVKAR
jgi:hypothetical protein